MLRAKFYVDELTGDKDSGFSVKLSAVMSDENMENQDFNKYTPSGSLEMFVDNPKADGFFEEGKEYYLDFTPAKGD